MTNGLGKTRTTQRFVAKVAGLIAAGALVVGCHVGSTTTTTTTTSTSSTTTTTQASSTTTSTTTTIALQACSTGVVSASAASGGIAAGTGYEKFTVTNGGPASCFVKGYVNLAFFGPSAAGGAGAGPHLSVTVAETNAASAQVTLATHDSATFSMRYSSEPVGGGGCVTVASAELGLPGGSETLSFPVTLTVCGGGVQIGPLGAPGA